jgi:hypothetical protein
MPAGQADGLTGPTTEGAYGQWRAEGMPRSTTGLLPTGTGQFSGAQDTPGTRTWRLEPPLEILANPMAACAEFPVPGCTGYQPVREPGPPWLPLDGTVGMIRTPGARPRRIWPLVAVVGGVAAATATLTYFITRRSGTKDKKE